MTYSRHMGFNSQPREGGWLNMSNALLFRNWFQLAATRRRLDVVQTQDQSQQPVSTRSHAKAAGLRGLVQDCIHRCFNSQPREGGWMIYLFTGNMGTGFQLAATRRRLDQRFRRIQSFLCFNSQPREGGWESVANKLP